MEFGGRGLVKCSGVVFCCHSVVRREAKMLDLDLGVQEEYPKAFLFGIDVSHFCLSARDIQACKYWQCH